MRSIPGVIAQDRNSTESAGIGIRAVRTVATVASGAVAAISGIAPALDAATGHPHAIASRTGSPKPSYRLG